MVLYCIYWIINITRAQLSFIKNKNIRLVNNYLENYRKYISIKNLKINVKNKF